MILLPDIRIRRRPLQARSVAVVPPSSQRTTCSTAVCHIPDVATLAGHLQLHMHNVRRPKKVTAHRTPPPITVAEYGELRDAFHVEAFIDTEWFGAFPVILAPK